MTPKSIYADVRVSEISISVIMVRTQSRRPAARMTASSMVYKIGPDEREHEVLNLAHMFNFPSAIAEKLTLEEGEELQEQVFAGSGRSCNVSARFLLSSSSELVGV